MGLTRAALLPTQEGDGAQEDVLVVVGFEEEGGTGEKGIRRVGLTPKPADRGQ
jgi:hypothetical protein